MGLIWWFIRIASHRPRFSNIVLGVPLSGRFVKWFGGLAEQRTLPRYSNPTFTNWFAHRDAPPAPSNAGYALPWPDTWNNSFHPEPLFAAVRVLEAAGLLYRISQRDPFCLRWLFAGGKIGRAGVREGDGYR